MDPKQTVAYILVALLVLIVSMVAYAVGARKNDSGIKREALAFLCFGWFCVYATHRFLSPEEAPRYFEANISIEADGRGVCALPVSGLYPRELLIRARSAAGANSLEPVEMTLELRAENGGQVAIASKDVLVPGGGGNWQQIRKEFAPKAEGDHLLTIATSVKVGTIQVLVEY
jgi:hypothetical protein